MPSRRALLASLLACAGAPALAQTGPHPADDYRRAAALWSAGRRDDAIDAFYRAQYRYRVHLAARPDLPKDGDPALFAALSDAVGRPINQYAFGDIPRLLQTLDRVIADAGAQDDAFTPKAQFAAAHARTLAGLRSMRDEIDGARARIRAERVRNGLENRD